MKHFRYLWYVLRHKWYCFLECCKLGMPLVGITHDLSKFRPSEWFGYVEKFYGDKEKQNRRQFDLASDYGGLHEMIPWGLLPDDQFKLAWLHHQRRNPHHWQYWVYRKDEGEVFPVPMPRRYLKEMVADWRAMGRTFDGAAAWYEKNRDKILLREEDRAVVEEMIGYEPPEECDRDLYGLRSEIETWPKANP